MYDDYVDEDEHYFNDVAEDDREEEEEHQVPQRDLRLVRLLECVMDEDCGTCF